MGCFASLPPRGFYSSALIWQESVGGIQNTADFYCTVFLFPARCILQRFKGNEINLRVKHIFTAMELMLVFLYVSHSLVKKLACNEFSVSVILSS